MKYILHLTLALFFFLVTITASFAQGDAPTILQGQNSATKNIASKIWVPGNQATKITSSAALLETGNNNILQNPSFEALPDPKLGWTAPTSPTLETSDVVNGKQALVFSPSATAFEVSQDSTINATAFADGLQGVAYCKVKVPTTVTADIKFAPRRAGAIVSSLEVSVPKTGKWEQVKVPFILGATSNGVSVHSAGYANITETGIKIDDCFVGVADVTQEVGVVGPWQSYTPTSSTWTSNITWSGKYRQVGQDIEVSVTGSVTGAPSVSAELSVSLPSGYSIDTSKIGNLVPTGSALLRDNSDSRNYQAGIYHNSGAVYVRTSASSTLAGAAYVMGVMASNTSPFTWANGDSISLSFKVPVNELSSSSTVYSSRNADTDWQSCTFSTLAWQGLGTVTSSLQCKRQGGDLLMRGRATLGAVSASTIQIPLPTWGGSQLTSKSNISTTEISGRAVRSNAAADNLKTYVPLIIPSVSYINLATDERSLASNPLVALAGSSAFSSSDIISIETRIPISGWENSNIMIAQLDGLESCEDSYECTDTFSAYISSTGVVSGENVDWINGNATVTGTSYYAITYKSGLKGNGENLSNTLHCTANAVQGSFPATTQITANTVSGATIHVYRPDSSHSAAASDLIVKCSKYGSDYIGKTAKAVASDQNVRSIGAVGVDIQSVTFGAGVNCGSPCTTGTCSICRQTGGKITSVTWSSTGTYNINGIDGTKYTCYGSGVGSAYSGVIQLLTSSTTSYAQVRSGNTAAGDIAIASVTCIGIP